MFDCVFFNLINHCRNHEKNDFVSINVDRKFIVNVDFSNKSIKIHIICEFIEI